MYKDAMTEIAYHLNAIDVLNLSLSCKKYYRWLWDNKFFWMNRNIKEFKVFGGIELYIKLHEIKEAPQHYYNKSIIEKNLTVSKMIFRSFKVYFPYVGIISKYDRNYFGITNFNNLKNIPYVPDNIPNIKEAGNLTLSHYSQQMGLPYQIYNTNEELISGLQDKLYEMKLIYVIGDPISFKK